MPERTVRNLTDTEVSAPVASFVEAGRKRPGA
jgi:hypothetical protein